VNTLCILADQVSPLASLASHTLLRNPLVTSPCKFSVYCLCDSSQVVTQTLGQQPCDTNCRQLLCSRMLRSLASLAHRTRQTHSDILRHVDARVTSSAAQLAKSAVLRGSSSECWLANAFQITRKTCFSIRALCSYFTAPDTQSTGLGIILAVKSSTRWMRVYEGSVLLGSRCPESLAAFESGVCALLSLSSLLSSLLTPADN
jgi:hypothetical protein